MNKLQLFRELRHHRKLAEQRVIDPDKQKVALVLIYLGKAAVLVYLVMFAITFSLAANSTTAFTASEVICGIIPFVFILDFFLRFAMQQTPSQIVKPYVLLPLSKHTCIDFFIANQLLSSSNFVWFAMLVPFCIMSVVFSYGIFVVFGLLLFFWLLELCINQFYTIVRTLVNDTLLWWIPIILLIAAMFLPGLDFANIGYVLSDFNKAYSFTDLFQFYGNAGFAIETGQAWPYALLLVLLCILVAINRRVQFSHIMREVAEVEKTPTIGEQLHTKWLERFGETGLFLSLEVKTVFRNKNPRKGFIMGIAIVIVSSLLIAFTEIYDQEFMGSFYCLYDYVIFPSIILTKIMCNEGNYIDALMVRKENVLRILRAKYIFNCIYLIVPLLLMLPTVISGKWSLLMLVAYGVFTAGAQYFMLFQLAVYNNTSQPLNAKLTSSHGSDNSKMQLVIQTACMFVPLALVSVLKIFLSADVTYIIMLLMGVVCIATSDLWLRHIYRRFMARRYVNMEGFRISR